MRSTQDGSFDATINKDIGFEDVEGASFLKFSHDGKTSSIHESVSHNNTLRQLNEPPHLSGN